jgi:hypothetical protein
MRLVLAVFHALRTFDRPATRAELERETGLSAKQVWKGLDGLYRRKLLVQERPGRRNRGLFELLDRNQVPWQLRGRYERSAEHREHMRVARTEGAGSVPASPKLRSSRVTVKEKSRAPQANCLLEQLWKPK